MSNKIDLAADDVAPIELNVTVMEQLARGFTNAEIASRDRGL
jgi:hypothetical protein